MDFTAEIIRPSGATFRKLNYRRERKKLETTNGLDYNQLLAIKLQERDNFDINRSHGRRQPNTNPTTPINPVSPVNPNNKLDIANPANIVEPPPYTTTPINLMEPPPVYTDVRNKKRSVPSRIWRYMTCRTSST